jgi:hypothetical protein
MKTQDLESADLTAWPLRTRLASTNQIPDFSETKGYASTHPVAVGKTGRPLGWIERTLLAVDNNRVFIEASDPRLREELASEYAAENRDVIAASDSQTLLKFMEQLPIPTDPGNDVVIAEDDFPGTTATDLRRQLQARGWCIPVFTVWNQSPCVLRTRSQL